MLLLPLSNPSTQFITLPSGLLLEIPIIVTTAPCTTKLAGPLSHREGINTFIFLFTKLLLDTYHNIYILDWTPGTYQTRLAYYHTLNSPTGPLWTRKIYFSFLCTNRMEASSKQSHDWHSLLLDILIFCSQTTLLQCAPVFKEYWVLSPNVLI